MGRGRNRSSPAKRTAHLPRQDSQADSSSARTIAEVSESTTTYSGPLPPSTELAEYDRVLPGAAERILSMAESYAAHDQHQEADFLRCEYTDKLWGRLVAAVVVMVILGACIYALHLGHVEFATTLGSWTIVALAAVFVAGKVPEWITKSKP